MLQFLFAAYLLPTCLASSSTAFNDSNTKTFWGTSSYSFLKIDFTPPSYTPPWDKMFVLQFSKFFAIRGLNASSTTNWDLKTNLQNLLDKSKLTGRTLINVTPDRTTETRPHVGKQANCRATTNNNKILYSIYLHGWVYISSNLRASTTTNLLVFHKKLDVARVYFNSVIMKPGFTKYIEASGNPANVVELKNPKMNQWNELHVIVYGTDVCPEVTLAAPGPYDPTNEAPPNPPCKPKDPHFWHFKYARASSKDQFSFRDKNPQRIASNFNLNTVYAYVPDSTFPARSINLKSQPVSKPYAIFMDGWIWIPQKNATTMLTVSGNGILAVSINDVERYSLGRETQNTIFDVTLTGSQISTLRNGWNRVYASAIYVCGNPCNPALDLSLKISKYDANDITHVRGVKTERPDWMDPVPKNLTIFNATSGRIFKSDMDTKLYIRGWYNQSVNLPSATRAQFDALGHPKRTYLNISYKIWAKQKPKSNTDFPTIMLKYNNMDLKQTAAATVFGKCISRAIEKGTNASCYIEQWALLEYPKKYNNLTLHFESTGTSGALWGFSDLRIEYLTNERTDCPPSDMFRNKLADDVEIASQVFIFVLVFLALCLLIYAIYYHRKNPGLDRVEYARLFKFFLNFFDFMSDISFAVLLFVKALFPLFIACIFFLALPYLLGMFVLVLLIQQWRNLRRDDLRIWLSRWDWFLVSIGMITGGYAAVELCNSMILPHPIFHMSLKRTKYEDFKQIRFFNVILMENLPQLIIQLVYIQTNSIDPISIIAISMTSISILVSTFTFCSRMPRKYCGRGGEDDNGATTQGEADQVWLLLSITSNDLGSEHVYVRLKLRSIIAKVCHVSKHEVEVMEITRSGTGISAYAVITSTNFNPASFKRHRQESGDKNDKELSKLVQDTLHLKSEPECKIDIDEDYSQTFRSPGFSISREGGTSAGTGLQTGGTSSAAGEIAAPELTPHGGMPRPPPVPPPVPSAMPMAVPGFQGFRQAPPQKILNLSKSQRDDMLNRLNELIVRLGWNVVSWEHTEDELRLIFEPNE